MEKLKTSPFKPLPIGGLLLAIAMTFTGGSGFSQTVLDEYVEAGLKRNRVLQLKNISYTQAQNALRIAKSHLLPSVNLLADYTSGEGGRGISVPLGDLLNPVYRSLNALTESDAFPDVPNVTQDFFPYDFYDVRLRVSLPIFNTGLIQGRKIHGLKVLMRRHEVDAYKRELIFEIKTGYYRYLAAVASIKIHESALQLIQKNIVIGESLLKNGKALPSHLHRLRSEREKVKADITGAVSAAENARRYFNFLLNRDQHEAIKPSFSIADALLSDTTQGSAAAREELKLLATALEVQEAGLKSARLSRLPKINAFLDLGSQASYWQFHFDSRYYLVGVQVSIPIFQGSRTNLNIRQQKLELTKAQLNLKNTEAQLALAVNVAKNELNAAIQNFIAAREQLTSAESYFGLTEKAYRAGIESLLSFLDARNHLTASELRQNLRSFELMIAYAKVERETASYPLVN